MTTEDIRVYRKPEIEVADYLPCHLICDSDLTGSLEDVTDEPMI